MSGAGFRDHFSGVAESYAAARPDYPPALFAALAAHAPHRKCAWDCATGSGQAATSLAGLFDFVVATDASTPQIAHARPHSRIRYVTSTAEAAPLHDGSIAIVTVAQALHWFDVERFYAEARRVLVPSGVIAAWSYHLATVTPDVDAILSRFYSETVGRYWPPERRHVETRYRELPFPFERIPLPAMTIDREMTATQFLAYVRTWSAVQGYVRAFGYDPVSTIEGEVGRAWGPDARRVRWPLDVLAGRIRS